MLLNIQGYKNARKPIELYEAYGMVYKYFSETANGDGIKVFKQALIKLGGKIDDVVEVQNRLTCKPRALKAKRE